MQKINNYCLIFLTFILVSCNEVNFLEENPKSFLTTHNAYKTYEDFENAVYEVYAISRDMCFGSYFEYSQTIFMHSGTDMWYDARESASDQRFGDYDIALNPESKIPISQWRWLYKIINFSNTIIDRSQESELDELEKTKIESEAKFFRAFAYRHLVYLYGDVPLVLNEINSPQADFEKASKEEILSQVISDFKFASENLPNIAEVNGERVSKLVALHYLAETYISIGQFDEAISSASLVIDDPNTALMTNRFGSRQKTEPGDVYWDLFRKGNQNRSTGNTEALWIAPMEANVPGGLLSTANLNNNAFERIYIPAIWTLDDPDGVPAVSGYVGDDNCGGRGSAFCKPTDYFVTQIWESDFENDIRNSPNNFIRTLKYTNPNSAWVDSNALEYRGSVIDFADWRWYPWLTKATTPSNHPDELYTDKDNLLLSAQAGSTFRDMYWLRLPETYLIRAEAYIRKGMLNEAADDINIIRSRSNASPISTGGVDLDYLLDERARELSLESPRRLTLMRMNVLVERVREYNKWNQDEIKDYHRLFPIPFSEIEANIYAKIDQNPGYPK